MAPEENAGTELLLQGFDRRFLAARTLRSFPWQPSGGSVTLSESTAIISHGTTGLVTWDATAEWAIENPAAFTNRHAVLPRSHRVAGRGPVEAGCLPGAQADS
ncbi:LOW QUALITY PROTEIN: FAM86B1 isoform 1 [Pan troglodytes]|uniref:FAM86B1 isoform 1 n=1 Tax=Pan troglodytes TaxID=9598 RepID=A0A2J8IKS0_PANTR|nr:LOW QUALITY PROTEIN: FAM86B1 isoform 1 [Pan troglodytes]